MRHCLRYFIHGRKARVQQPRESPEDKMDERVDELPSYTDLFGYPEDHSGQAQLLSPEVIQKQPDTKSEVFIPKSKEFDPLDLAKCTTVLTEASGRNQAEDRRLARLAAECRGCQTTAQVVGAYMAQTKISCGRYIRTIQEKSELNLYSALDLTLDHIKKVNPDAAQLFMFFAYFDHADLAYDLVAAAHVTQSTWISRVTSSVHKYESTMRWLHGYGLVDNDTVIYTLKPLVHQWLCQSLRSGPLFSTFSLALRCVASAQEIVSKRNHRGRSSRFTQHAQHLTTIPFDNMWRFAMQDPNCVDSIISLAQNCLRQKQLDKSTALGELVMNAPCLSASNMSNLAKYFAKQNQNTKAEQLYNQALNLFRKDCTGSSTLRLKTLRRLDHLSKTLCRTEECEEILKDVLDAPFQEPHECHNASDIVRAYAELAVCRHEQRRYDEAIVLYRTALENYEVLLDPNDSQLLFVFKRMGDTFRSQREFDKAGTAYGRVAVGYSKKYGRFSYPRRKMATRLEKAALAFIATEEGKNSVKGSEHGSPQLKQVYTRWGCRNS